MQTIDVIFAHVHAVDDDLKTFNGDMLVVSFGERAFV